MGSQPGAVQSSSREFPVAEQHAVSSAQPAAVGASGSRSAVQRLSDDASAALPNPAPLPLPEALAP